MSKEDVIEIEGAIVEVLPRGLYRVLLENKHEVEATVAGRMKMHNIRIVVGDKVTLQVSPYDLTQGRIVYRKKVGG